MKIATFFLFFLSYISTALAQSSEAFEQKTEIYTTEVYFDFAQYNIREDADSSLQEMIRLLQSKDILYTIQITAHTDFVGTNERNQILSQNRAEAVKGFLVANGITAEQISIAVYGEEQPQASNDTDQGRQLNRRATVKVFQVQKMLPFTAQILDEDSNIPADASIIIRTKDGRDSLQADQDGRFTIPLPLNTVIGIDVYAKCYFLFTQMLKVNPKSLANLKIRLKKAKVGSMTNINNLYFVGNQDVLLKKSEPELPKLLRFMQLNDCLKMEIAGHVNVPNRPKVAEDSPHFDLSTRRAKRVYDYLIEQGISKDRLQYQGYGNWEMVYPKAVSEKKQALNRRVEIRVLEREDGKDCLCKW